MPKIARQRLDEGETHPPERPDEDRQRIETRVGAAEETGQQQEQQEGEAEGAAESPRGQTDFTEIQARGGQPLQGPRRQEEDKNERDMDRERATGQVIAGRQEQHETAAAGMGKGRPDTGAEPGKEQAQDHQEVPPAGIMGPVSMHLPAWKGAILLGFAPSAQLAH